MASPIAIVGSRINHLRRRADLKYSLIFRGLNSTLIRALLSKLCTRLVTAWPESFAPRPLPENSLSRLSAGHSGFRGGLRACHQWRPVPRPNENDKWAMVCRYFGAKRLHRPSPPSSVVQRRRHTDLSCSKPSPAYRRSSALPDLLARRSAPAAPLRPGCLCLDERRTATRDYLQQRPRSRHVPTLCDSYRSPRRCFVDSSRPCQSKCMRQRCQDASRQVSCTLQWRAPVGSYSRTKRPMPNRQRGSWRRFPVLGGTPIPRPARFAQSRRPRPSENGEPRYSVAS